MTQKWENRYFEQVVPRMTNVDHTPAINFIHQERKSLLEGIREGISKLEYGDSCSGNSGDCGSSKYNKGLSDALSIVERELGNE